MSFEFELVTVRAEISHAHTVARRPSRIGDNQVRIRREACPKRVGCESQEEKKTTHPTTDNADATDVEEEDAHENTLMAQNESRLLQSVASPHAGKRLQFIGWC